MKFTSAIPFTLLLLLIPFFGQGQVSLRDSSCTFSIVNITYGGFSPGGDMAKRFGYTSLVGGDYTYKHKSNFYFSIGGQFLFGSNVRVRIAENVIQYVVDSVSGQVSTVALGEGGQIRSVRLFERGIVIPVVAGKIIPILPKPNKNSGIYVEIGGQFIQHRVRIEVVGQDIPALDKTYRRGYDRMAMGFGLKEGLGYRYTHNKNYLNFFAGVEFSQNFTKPQRSINYDTGLSETGSRMDLLIGFKVGWSFLIVKRASEGYYQY